jgi:predicted short-subunit dehydrogenase-like oxidoreductase (DUF2520 family)
MHSSHDTLPRPRLGVVGAGRLGTALAAALIRAGHPVEGPTRRGQVPAECEAIVLCVPDAEISAAARAVAGAAPLIGHTSGATPLSALAPAAGRTATPPGLFGLHPLQTFGDGAGAEAFEGAGCAIAGDSDEALAFARTLAEELGMTPFEIAEDGRAAYHAAASIASNFLVALEDAAERVAAGAGLEPGEARALLAPLVRRTVAQWSAVGPERALTGPVARGDEATVTAQREAVAAAAPELLPLFDELVERARQLARRGVPA